MQKRKQEKVERKQEKKMMVKGIRIGNIQKKS